MTNDNMGHGGGDGNGLVPVDVGGEARVRDLDLAVRLGFERPRKIKELIERHMAALLRMGVCPTVGRTSGAQGGRPTEDYYLNRKQAIFITAKSETPEATDITIEIIEKFDAYEKGAAQPATLPDFDDPRLLQTLLVEHLGKRIEAEKRADAAEKKAEAASETVAAFDRIANAEGTLCITDAAKALQVQPKALFTFMRQRDWVYNRPGKAGDIAYQDKLKAGYLDHKVTVVTRLDGSEKTTEQVRVTSKGLAKLAMIVPGAKGLNGNHPRAE